MLKRLKPAALCGLKGVTTAALLSGALLTQAVAEDAKIKSASFSIQPVYQGDEIVVTSSDGQKWDTISSKALKLSANMAVDTKHPGYVKQIGILLGGCHNTGCANNPVMYYEGTSTRDLNVNRVFTFPGNKIPVSKNGIAVPSFGDEILKSCNNHLQPNGASKTYSFNKLLTASFSANTRKAAGGLPPVEVSHGSEVPDYNGGDVTRTAQFAVKVTCKAEKPEVGYVHLDIRVKPKNANQPGSCPATGTSTVFIPTTRPGPVTFKYYRNDGAVQTVTVEAEPAGELASGMTYSAKWVKTYNLTKSVDRKYMAVMIGHKYSTPWKPMVLKCGVQNDSPGPGTVADRPNPTHGEPVGGNVTQKPPRRPVIVTPVPPKRPAKPTIKVAPAPKVVCIGGKVANNTCFCPARTKKVQTGSNAYRCMVNVVKPKRATPNKLGAVKTAPVKRLNKFKRSSALRR